MAVVQKVTLNGTDWDPDATISGVYPSNGGSFSISGGSVYVAVQTGRPGGYQFGDAVPFDPGIGFVLPAGATGIRFKNQNASSPATVTAAIAAQGQLVPVGGSATTVTTTTSGVITGIVNSNGTISAGTGFTVNHSGTGTYVVTFTTPFAATPAIVATLAQASGPIGGTLSATSPTASGFTLLAYNGTPALADLAFAFLAYPVS